METPNTPPIADVTPPSSDVSSATARQVMPQHAQAAPCPSCAGGTGAATPSFVYVLGTITAEFRDESAKREFRQVAGRADTAGKTDQQTFHSVLSKRENRYLVRQMCWVLTVQGLETYLLRPRDPADFDLLVEAIRPVKNLDDTNLVIGERGPIAPPEMCNGLMVPIVVFDQIYSFGRDELLKSIPKPEKITAAQFGAIGGEVFSLIVDLPDNAGATNEHRALNYLIMRYPAIYSKAAEEFGRDFALTAVDVRPSALSGARNVVDVIFSYTNRNTDFMEKYRVSVDVTEEFPFLVTKLSPSL